MNGSEARTWRRPLVPLRTLAWLGSLAAILAVGLVCLPREYPEMGFWESLYCTARLFVFEYDLPHFPSSAPLVAIHFAAPIVAVSAAWTILNRLFRLTPALRVRWQRDHVVVCGVGRTGRLLAAALKQEGVAVVGVDIIKNDELDDWCAATKIPMIQGDFNSHLVLERARVRRARAIIFASGDDLANLEGAVSLYGWMKEVKRSTATGATGLAPRGKKRRVIWTHIANEKLAATANRVVAEDTTIRFFDTYRIAATRVVAQHFHRAARRGVDRAAIIGFGKFGRDLMDVLIHDLDPEQPLAIEIIDIHDRRGAVAALAEQAGVADQVSFRQADIHQLSFDDQPGTAFFLCTDDDMGNLAGAFEIASTMKASRVYVRMAKWPISAIADQLGADHAVTFININQLVTEGIRDLPGLFTPIGG